MTQILDLVEDKDGRSVGCILELGGMIIAITPSGAQRNCENRKSATWFLQEKAAGRDPDRPRPLWEFLKRVGVTLWLVACIGSYGVILYGCVR